MLQWILFVSDFFFHYATHKETIWLFMKFNEMQNTKVFIERKISK